LLIGISGHRLTAACCLLGSLGFLANVKVLQLKAIIQGFKKQQIYNQSSKKTF